MEVFIVAIKPSTLANEHKVYWVMLGKGTVANLISFVPR